MNTVLSLIIMLSQNTLKNDTTKIISHYIISHINDLKDMTIKQMAEGCYTSTTSIIKFYEMLGFNSYIHFTKNLLSGIKTRNLQLIEKYNKIELNQLYKDFETLSVEKVDKEVFLNSIAKSVECIYENKEIHFYGATFPLALTLSFIEDMSIMGISSHIHQMYYGDDFSNNQDGLHIIITLTGRFTKHHKSVYKNLCKKDNKVILISQDISYTNDLLMNIKIPKTKNYDYNELVLLIILDMIKVNYYKNYYTSHF